MKKIQATLLSILLITLALASCNLDGTTGIFREIAQSKAPLSIRYRQLLGKKGSELYFRTLEGVERVTTAKLNTTVVASKYEHIIQAASLSGTKVFYTTNNLTDRTKINVVDTTNLTLPVTQMTIAPTVFMPSDVAINNLYANSTILVSGKDGASKVFELFRYDGTDFATSVAQFTMPSNTYDLYEVIQQTSKEQIQNAEMIVSFVDKSSGAREHHLVNPFTSSKINLGTEDVTIANFLYVSPTNIYVLTTDGKIYYVNGTTWTSIGTSSKSYETNAFALAVDDGTNYHLITKPSTKTSSLHVFSFLNSLPNTSVGSAVDVKSGYAKELALATIVSSQVKSTVGTTSTDLLIATNENGMYNIFIKHADANKDISTNGTSSEGEGYSFP